jgi:hypothetical protein
MKEISSNHINLYTNRRDIIYFLNKHIAIINARFSTDLSRDMVSIRVFYFEKFDKMYSDGMFLFVIFQHCYHAVCDTTALLDGLKE